TGSLRLLQTVVSSPCARSVDPPVGSASAENVPAPECQSLLLPYRTALGCRTIPRACGGEPASGFATPSVQSCESKRLERRPPGSARLSRQQGRPGMVCQPRHFGTPR